MAALIEHRNPATRGAHCRARAGYTLIELMIVITIIGILSAIAIPAYQDYAVRAKITDVMTLAGAGKVALFEEYASNGAMPSTTPPPGSIIGDWLGAVANSRYVGNVMYSVAGTAGLVNNQAKILVTLASTIGGGAANRVIGFVYTATANGMAMECNAASGTNVPERYLPSVCR